MGWGPKGPLSWDALGSQGFPSHGGPGPAPMGSLGLPRVPSPMGPLPWDPFGLPRVPSHGVPPHPIPVRFAPHPADRPRVASRFKLEKTRSFISHSCILMRIHGIGPYAIPGPFPHCITTPPLNQTLFVFLSLFGVALGSCCCCCH